MGRFSLKRLAAVARLEGLQLVRDRSALMLIVLLPVMQLLLYGYAVNLFPDHTRLAIAGDNPAAVADAARASRRGGAFDVLTGAGLTGSAEAAVRAGRASLGLEIDTTPFGASAITVFADGADPATSRPALAVLEAGLLRGLAASETAAPISVTWLNAPRGGASWAATPGLVGVIVMVSMLFLGAMTLVRERERGTWETLLATPVRPAEALAGKLSPYLVVGMVEAVILLLSIHFLFGIPLPPASWALVLMTPLFATSYLVLGFFFSAVAQNQLQAVQGAVGVYLPSLLLSGFLFPFDGMPGWARAIGNIAPLTHYLRASRAILLRGQPAAAIIPSLAPIALFTVVLSAMCLVVYRRRLT